MQDLILQDYFYQAQGVTSVLVGCAYKFDYSPVKVILNYEKIILLVCFKGRRWFMDRYPGGLIKMLLHSPPFSVQAMDSFLEAVMFPKCVLLLESSVEQARFLLCFLQH